MILTAVIFTPGYELVRSVSERRKIFAFSLECFHQLINNLTCTRLLMAAALSAVSMSPQYLNKGYQLKN